MNGTITIDGKDNVENEYISKGLKAFDICLDNGGE